jgi:DNA-binding transcriptional ArsR family regulator
MIDRIRQDIQDRLDQLLTEADRLRQALSALGGESSSPAGRRPRAASTAAARPRAATGGRRSSSTRARASADRGTRAAAGGGTKSSVLKALADANGQAMTASEVAAATGLGRASVSTTLSKLARAGDVTKADRGYQLSAGDAAPAAAAAE